MLVKEDTKVLEDRLLLAIDDKNTDPAELLALMRAKDDLNTVVSYVIFDKLILKTTYLLYAILKKNIPVIQALLECGADPNFGNDSLPLWEVTIFTGETAEEAKNGLRIAKLLLEYGADPNQIIPGKDETVLEEAKWWAETAFDPSSDYDYRYSASLYELYEAKINNQLAEIDMDSFLEIFDD